MVDLRVDPADARGASESLPREGSGTRSGPGHGGLFLEVAWDLLAALFGPVGTCSLQRILTIHRKCLSHSYLFRGGLKALLASCQASPEP